VNEKSEIHDVNFFVLQHVSAAGAVLEIGNLANDDDARFISNPAHQREIAQKIVSAFVKY
jgi:N-acetylmuramoyl-L-alanine amidase